MGQDAGRDCLEELKRGPGDHQHVEDEAGCSGTFECAHQQRSGVEEYLLAEHDQEDRADEAGPVGHGELLPLGFHVDLGVVALCPLGLFAAGAPGDRIRDHHQREQRGGDDADRDHGLAGEQADRHQDGEQGPEYGFGEDQRGEQAELLVSGEVAAGVVAGRVEQDSREEDPVERGVAVQQAVLDRALEDQRHGGEGETERDLDAGGHPYRPGVRVTSLDVLGDVPGEQLVDRPVEGRDGDEDGRPQDRDLAV